MASASVVSGQPSINVQWNPPSSDQAIVYYEVEFKISTRNRWTTHGSNITSNLTSLTDLNLGERYQVRVRAVSVLGSGDWSDTVEEVTYNGNSLST